MNLQNRSSFQAVKGQDALFAYQPIGYQPDTYVERNGLIFKSLSATSTTFIPQEWELIADLREVRVPNISSRNALTGMTATTGTTGIRIPILDNTNVLVLDAFSDPQVAVHEFARYNYNQSTGKWLLLQKGTGTTSTNVSNYQLLTNKPPVISGVTVNAGNGLVGGGSIFGVNVSPFSAGGVISVSHADTSSQPSLNGSGYAYVQKLEVDTFGHVTGATLSTWIHPSGLTQNFNNTGYTYIQSIQVNNGHITGAGISTWVHPHTSIQGNSNNSGNVFIQSIQLDSNGHVTGINTGTAAGGGGGSPLRYNGDFGGALTMSSGGTLTISGGTAIKTTRTGGAINAGLRIDVVTGVGANQVLYSNGSNGFSGSPNFVFSGGTNTLRTTNLILTGLLNFANVPTSGSTSNALLTRNSVSGNVERLSIAALPGAPTNSNQYNSGNGFGGNANWLFDPTNQALTLGTRTGTTGQNSFVIGTNNSASIRSVVIGIQNRVQSVGGTHLVLGTLNTITGSSTYSFAGGQSNKITGSTSGNFVYGNSNTVAGGNSATIGLSNLVIGVGAIGLGTATKVSGANAISIGNGFTVGLPLLSSGFHSINISNNTSGQASNQGATGTYSAIFGGVDGHINQNDTASVILGGRRNIMLLGGQYSAMIGGNTNLISGATIQSAALIGGNSNKIQASNSNFNSIVGGTNNLIGGVADNTSSAIIGGNGNSISGGVVNSVIVGGSGLQLTGTTQSGFVLVPGLMIFTNPGAGNNDDMLTWNVNTKKVTKVTQNSIGSAGNGINKAGNVYRLGGNLTGNTTIGGGGVLTLNNGAWTFGSRGTGAVGSNSFTVGDNNVASGFTSSFAFGSGCVAAGNFSMAVGAASKSLGSGSIALGSVTKASGQVSFAGGWMNSADLTKPLTAGGGGSFIWSVNTPAQVAGHGSNANGSAILGGQDHNIPIGADQAAILGGTTNVASGAHSVVIGGSLNVASGQNAVAMGLFALASGVNSLAFGDAAAATVAITANGRGSVNLSSNSGSQVAGRGAYGQNSAIIGGVDHNIDSSNPRAAIIGGNGINLPAGGNYSDFVAVPSLALFNTPTSSVGSDLVLAWNSTDKKVKLGTLSSTSDERLKTNIVPLTGILDKIQNLNTYEYANNEVIKPMEGIKNYGLTAQEVEQVFPHVVKDNYVWEGETYKTVDYRHLVPVLFAAIKELNDKIKTLESKLNG